MSIIVFVLGLAIWLTFFVSLFLFLETLLAAVGWGRYKIIYSDKNLLNSPTAFLIPAHNEEQVILDTLKSIQSQLCDGDEVIVIADNCTDKTKDIAQEFGVVVLERVDDVNKGKGFALDYGLEFIKTKSFEVVIIVDADCLLEEGCRDLLVDEVLREKCSVQALYMMKSSGNRLAQKFAEFTWAIKNKVRPLGLLVMGGPCQLTGTGMAFPIKAFANTDIASGCIVEDMKLGLDLALGGRAPKLLPRAVVYSEFPETDEVAEGQKSRWVHGHLDMIIQYVPKLLFQSIKMLDFRVLLLAIDLMIPPLILLILLNVVLLLSSIVLAFFSINSMYLWSFLSILLVAVSIFISWLLEGRKYLTFNELYLGGITLLKKLTLYGRFFTNKRSEWNKTSRK